MVMKKVECSSINKMVRIGGGTPFVDDSVACLARMSQSGVDYIVFDYLAEVSMSWLAREPKGYSPVFMRDMEPLLRDILAQGTKIVDEGPAIT
jgi:hypothetical protein